MTPLGKTAGNGPGTPARLLHRSIPPVGAVNGVLTAFPGVLSKGGRA